MLNSPMGNIWMFETWESAIEAGIQYVYEPRMPIRKDALILN